MAHGGDERKIFLEALENTPFIALASKKAGISRSTAHRWMREDVDFRIAVKQALRVTHDKLGEAAYSVLHEKVKQKDLNAAKFVLVHYPSLYGVKEQEADVQIEAKKEHTEDWRNMTREERKEVSRRDFEDAFTDGEGNWVMSRKTAELLIQEGDIKAEDIIGEVSEDPNDPIRRNLTPPVPHHAVRVRM